MAVTWQLHAKRQDLLLRHLKFIKYTTGGLDSGWDVSIVTIWFSNLVSGWLALHQGFGIALLVLFSLIIILLLLFSLLIILLSSEQCVVKAGSRLRWTERSKAMGGTLCHLPLLSVQDGGGRLLPIFTAASTIHILCCSQRFPVTKREGALGSIMTL